MDNPVRFPSRSWEGPTNLAPPMDDKMANTGAAPQAQNSYKAACTLSAPNQPVSEVVFSQLNVFKHIWFL